MGSDGRTGWRWRWRGPLTFGERGSRNAERGTGSDVPRSHFRVPRSECLIPPPRQPDRRADEADHAVGLDEVAPLLPGARIHVLGEQAVAVAAGEHVFEQRPRLVAPSDGGERVDVPEGADQKGVLRRSEVVLLDISENEVAASQLALDGGHGASEARVVVRQEAELVQPQQARVQRIAIHRGDEAASPGAPAPLVDHLVDARGLVGPVRRTLGQPQMRGDFRQAVAPGPAHHAGEGVHARFAAQLPEPSVRLVEQTRGVVPERFEPTEQDVVAAVHQAAVEEHVGGGEDGRAIDVVLHLPVRLIPDPHRAHAAIAGQGIDRPLVGDRPAGEAIDGLQPAVGRAGHNVDDVAEIALHGTGGPESVEGIDHEVRVAQPAMAVVPVPAAARRFGNGGRHRRDDRPRVFEHIELQRDRRADHGVLPLERDAERAHPVAPVRGGLFEEAAADVRHGALHRLVRSEQQGDGVLQVERSLLTTDASIAAPGEETPFYLEDTVTLLLGPDETVQGAVADVGRRFFEETAAYWRDWVRSLGIPFEWQDAVIRSAITLQLNVFEDTGAIVAAMTTSIPEAPGSGRNWDYRHCWLRDAYFGVNALNRLGATRTMERYLGYLVNVVAGSADGRLQPVYGLTGRAVPDERSIDSLPGYRGMGPVRVGNQAYRQVQHDVYGAAILAATHVFFDRRL